jgi:hypothetical protein
MPQPRLERKIGPLQATAMNMTQMCGIGPCRTGRLMPFLFARRAVLFIPLIMSTGIIGLVVTDGTKE